MYQGCQDIQGIAEYRVSQVTKESQVIAVSQVIAEHQVIVGLQVIAEHQVGVANQVLVVGVANQGIADFQA